jgi:hypothetical protein
MDFIVTSTTDSKEQVQAAQGIAKPAPKAVEDKSAAAEQTAAETAVESETTENETEETAGADGANESEVEAEGEESADKSTENGKPVKKKSGFQRRIGKLRGELSAKDQELGYLRSELEKARGVKSADQPATKTVKDDGRPNKDTFDTHDDYVEALADWKVDQRLKADRATQAENSAKSEGQKKLDTHVGRVKEFAKSNPDFEEVIRDLDDGPKVSLTVQEVILGSDNGPELMYQLAKNRKEFERINALPPISAARELGKFEAKFSKPSETETPTKTTKAPKPATPIASKSSASAKSPDDMSFEEYKAWHAKKYGAGA